MKLLPTVDARTGERPECFIKVNDGRVYVAKYNEFTNKWMLAQPHPTLEININSVDEWVFVASVFKPSNAKVTGSPALSASPCGLPG